MLNGQVSLDFFKLDDRSIEERLEYIRSYCEKIPFIEGQSVFSWADFFFRTGVTNKAEETLTTLANLYNNPDQADGLLAPEQVFLLAFLKMQDTATSLLNTLPRAHKQLYYRGYLGLEFNPIVADTVMASFVINDSLADLQIPDTTLLNAGSYDDGNPIQYKLQQSLLANLGTWTDLYWTDYREVIPKSYVAYSVESDVTWPDDGYRLFDDTNSIPVTVGRIVGSNSLNLSGGERIITLVLASDITDLIFSGIKISVTTESGWIEVDAGNAVLAPLDTITITLPVDFDPITPPPPVTATEFEGFESSVPWLKIYKYGGNELPEIATIGIEVNDLPGVNYSTNFQTADVENNSYPFGTTPKAGLGINLMSSDWIGKKTLTIELTPEWMELPEESFVTWYSTYTNTIIANDNEFTGQFYYTGKREGSVAIGSSIILFADNTDSMTAPVGVTITTGAIAEFSGEVTDSTDPRDWNSWLHMELGLHDFYHAEYYAQISAGATDLNVPYLPEWKRIKIDYSCTPIAPEQQYVLTPFGIGNSFSTEWARYLYLGFSNILPGQGLNLHWQLESPKGQQVTWEYLGDNETWMALDEYIDDQTDSLFHSGLWYTPVPADAAVQSQWMPPGRVWIRGIFALLSTASMLSSRDSINAALNNNLPVESAAVNNQQYLNDTRLYYLHTNSVLAVRELYTDSGEAIVYDGTSLPSETITQTTVAIEGLDSILQPFVSEGGQALEKETEFNDRVSKRLNNRNRVLNASDIRDLLLEEYAELHDVLLPTAREIRRFTQLSLTMVVIPANGSQDNDDILRPVFSNLRLSDMADFIYNYSSLWLNCRLINPTYTVVAVAYKVQFKEGYNSEYGYRLLKESLDKYYMPWSYSSYVTIRQGYGLIFYEVMAYIQSQTYVKHVINLTLDGDILDIEMDADEVAIIETSVIP